MAHHPKDIHPIIYRQPSEVLPGDPREPYILVGNWVDGFTDLRRKRFEDVMGRIAPVICNLNST